MESRSWDSISLTAKNLLKRMLEYDQTRRISADDALQHPWLKVSILMNEFVFNVSAKEKPGLISSGHF